MTMFVQHGFPWEMAPWIALAFSPIGTLLLVRSIRRKFHLMR